MLVLASLSIPSMMARKSTQAQIKSVDRVAQRSSDEMLWPTGIEQFDLRSPIGQLCQLERRQGIAVGDTAQLATEEVQRLNRVTAWRRQQ
jgi:hypothetical protein